MRADQPVGERGCHGAWRSGRSVGFDPRSIDRDLLTSSSTFRSSGGFWTPRLTTKRLLSRHLERCRSWFLFHGSVGARVGSQGMSVGVSSFRISSQRPGGREVWLGTTNYHRRFQEIPDSRVIYLDPPNRCFLVTSPVPRSRLTSASKTTCWKVLVWFI